MKDAQEAVDTFYWSHGKCCAGCDWWRHHNSLTGDCTRSAPVSAKERWAMTGIENASIPLKAGHIITYRHHLCGDFRDEFNWSSLPLTYQRRVGVLRMIP